MTRLSTLALTLALLLPAACEDQGNAGDDNLLTGGSLVVIILIGLAVFLVKRRGRSG